MQLSHRFTALLVYPDGSVREYLIQRDEATGEHRPAPPPEPAKRFAHPLDLHSYKPNSIDDLSTTWIEDIEVEPLSV
jgi:hypothetical protein